MRFIAINVLLNAFFWATCAMLNGIKDPLTIAFLIITQVWSAALYVNKE